jgi:RimJ/RimL family protein N-acetyltransferase
MANLNPAYRISTQRLVIRCWHPGDIDLLSTAIAESLDHLRVWMPWAQEEPKEWYEKVEWLRQARGKFDLNQVFLYGIFNVDETKVFGGIGLHPRIGDNALEIGYWIHVAHINQGLATEAAAALTKVAFTIHGVERVEIHCDPANLKSASVARKLGFEHEATLKQRVQSHEGYKRDSMIWTLFSKEYLASKAAQALIEAYDVLGQKLG